MQSENPDWSGLDVDESRRQRRRWGKDEPHPRKSKMYRDSMGRLVNTREYAVAWGVLNRPYSSEELFKKCRDDADAPSYYYIVREWNGYTRYYRALVKAGMEPRPPRTDKEKRKIVGRAARDGFKSGLLEKDYDVAKVAAQYNISSRPEYEKVRRENPDAKALLPCVKVVIRRFGSWRRFLVEILKYSADAVLTRYVEESAAAGHWLRLSECDRNGIPIRRIMDILRPKLFNIICYRKLAALGLDGGFQPNGGKEER